MGSCQLLVFSNLQISPLVLLNDMLLMNICVQVEIETILAINENLLAPANWAGFEQAPATRPVPAAVNNPPSQQPHSRSM